MGIQHSRGTGARFAAWLWAVLVLFALVSHAQPFVFSAGTHGRVFPCSSCPEETAAGGWMHTAPLIREHQERYPNGAWFDLGNAFTGGDLPPDTLFLLPEIYQEL